MKSYTLDLPDDLVKLMENHPEINWDSIIQKTIEDYINKLQLTDALVSNSKFTEEDALEIGRLINKSALKEFVKEDL